MFNQFVYSCCFRNHSLFYKPGLVKFHVFQRSIFFNFSLPLHGHETSRLSQCVNVWDFPLYIKTFIDSLVMISMSTSTNADFLLVLKIIQTYCTCLTSKKQYWYVQSGCKNNKLSHKHKQIKKQCMVEQRINPEM